MLLNARFKNFLSFNQNIDGSPILFSMVPGKVQGKKEHIAEAGKFKVLKYMSFFGANASGKSNLVEALRFMKRSVHGKRSPKYANSYFRLNPENASKSSFFEISLLLNDVVYTYGFEVMLQKGQFIKEWLSEQHNQKSNKILFTRNTLTGEYKFYIRNAPKSLNEKLNIYASDINTDTTVLLLNILNKNKAKLYEEYAGIRVFRDVYRWFTRKLVIGAGDIPISNYTYLINKHNVNEVHDIINYFDTGIKDYEIVEVPSGMLHEELPTEFRKALMDEIAKNIAKAEAKNNTPAGIIVRSNKNIFVISFFPDTNEIKYQTIKFKHENKDVLFDFWEESDGTLRLLDLLDILLTDDSQTFVIDEFEARLHPKLTREFIRIFLNKTFLRNTQLIITTHETELMDLNLVRRDEIQMIQKEYGSTSILPLETKKIRFDKSVAKAYLAGEYGGRPSFEEK